MIDDNHPVADALRDGNVVLAMYHAETFSQELLVLHEDGQHETAERLARERLFDQLREQDPDVHFDGDVFEIDIGDFEGSCGHKWDGRGGLEPAWDVYMIHTPTDTEFEVEAEAFDPHLYDEAYRWENAEGPGEAALTPSERNPHL